jgi:hypothetical protein
MYTVSPALTPEIWLMLVQAFAHEAPLCDPAAVLSTYQVAAGAFMAKVIRKKRPGKYFMLNLNFTMSQKSGSRAVRLSFASAF